MVLACFSLARCCLALMISCFAWYCAWLFDTCSMSWSLHQFRSSHWQHSAEAAKPIIRWVTQNHTHLSAISLTDMNLKDVGDQLNVIWPILDNSYVSLLIHSKILALPLKLIWNCSFWKTFINFVFTRIRFRKRSDPPVEDPWFLNVKT